MNIQLGFYYFNISSTLHHYIYIFLKKTTHISFIIILQEKMSQNYVFVCDNCSEAIMCSKVERLNTSYNHRNG